MNLISIEKFLAEKKFDFFDRSFFDFVSKEGFKNTDWSRIPDEFLFYLFLHDEHILGRERTIETKKAYHTDLKEFMSFLFERGICLRSIEPEDLLAYQKYLFEEKKYKATTLRKKSTVMKQFLQYIYKLGVLPFDVTFKMKKVAQPKEQLVNRDLYPHEVKQILDFYKKRDWFAFTFISILLSSGMRIKELANAEWRKLFYHPKLERHFLTIIGKGNKKREVIIFEDVLEFVKELRRRRGLETELNPGDKTAFFPKSDGKHYNEKYLGSEFSRLIKKTELPFVKYREDPITPHTCRHYTAFVYANNNVDIHAIQQMLGHSSIITTERYLLRIRRLEYHAGVKMGMNFINNN